MTDLGPEAHALSVRLAAQRLRILCDPRGWGLIDALEQLALDQVTGAWQRAQQAPLEGHRVFACTPDESGGLADVVPLDQHSRRA